MKSELCQTAYIKKDIFTGKGSFDNPTEEWIIQMTSILAALNLKQQHSGLRSFFGMQCFSTAPV